MILKIAELNKVGKFDNINQSSDFQFGDKNQNCNIIFGFNGSGKTTLSNIFSLFSNNSFITEPEKTELFEDIKSDDNAFVKLKVQGNTEIKYPDKQSYNKEIYVFNSDFVSSHVFNGNKSCIKKFANVSGEIKNQEIDTLNTQWDKLSEEKSALDREILELDNKNAEITKNRSDIFGKSLTDKGKKIQAQNLNTYILPTKSKEEYERILEASILDYDLSKKQKELNFDIEELQQLQWTSVIIDLRKITELLLKNVQQLSKEALEKKITNIQNMFVEDAEKQSVERWYKFGKRILENLEKENAHCPLCNSEIGENLSVVLSDFQGYFDKTYEVFIDELRLCINEVNKGINSIEDFSVNYSKLNKVSTKYEKMFPDVIVKAYDPNVVLTHLKELKNQLESKENNIQNNFTIPGKLNAEIETLNKSLLLYENISKVLMNHLQSKQIKTNDIEDTIRKISKDLIVLEFNNSSENLLEEYKKKKERITRIEMVEMKKIKEELNKELKKIKAESKSISKYLLEMGIDNFDIDINEDQPEENIIIKYKQLNKAKNKIKNSLSDGEKTALAFAYFLSKFNNEVNTLEKIKKAVVVIDDPISSLDENRLYSTARLISENFKEIHQLFVLSHNLLFLKFFHSFYKKNVKCFFLEMNILSDLPEELKNFETPYLYMLKEIVSFLEGRKLYTDCYKYLPNFIRRVLETFLSFKFARIQSSKNPYYSPGIEDFDQSIKDTDFEGKVKQELISKINTIKGITDKFSHGNLQHMQENFFISETELRELANKTMQVIEIMDKLHKTSYIASQQIPQGNN